MKILHFVDAAGTDENFFKSENFVKISVTDNASVICSFVNAGELAPDQIDITVTAGKSDETALKMMEYMASGSIGNDGYYKFIAGTAPLQDASAIAYTAGS